MDDVAVIEDPAAAAVALDPVRSRLLAELATPASAAALAAKVGLPRQKVNYHLRALEARGLLRVAEERRHGGLTERVLQATAASYVVSPAALGATATPNRLSARYLIALAARLLREVARLDDKQNTLGARRGGALPHAGRPQRVRRRPVQGRDGGHRTPPPRRRPARTGSSSPPIHSPRRTREQHEREPDRGPRHARAGLGDDRDRPRDRGVVRAGRGGAARRRPRRDRHHGHGRRGRRQGHRLGAAAPLRVRGGVAAAAGPARVPSS